MDYAGTGAGSVQYQAVDEYVRTYVSSDRTMVSN